MRIDEIFDNPYEWSWTDRRGPMHKMMAVKGAAIGLGSVSTAISPERPSKISAMSKLMSATFDVEDDTIWVHFEGNKDGLWTVVFDSEINKLEKDNEFGKTDAGHPGKILATVIDIVKDFMVHYEPQELQFIAKDQKRASIYRAIVHKIKSYNKYKAQITKHGNQGEYFSLQR